MRASTVLVPLIAALAAPASSQPDSPVPLGEFRSVELQGGGRVTVRAGSERRLTVREGSLAISRVRLEGDRLIVERCPDRRCPHRYRFEVEVIAPALDALAVSNGGILHTSGAFPAHAMVTAAVSNGGTLDIRSLPAARVAASVEQGGRIFTRPGRELDASISNGGNVTYWGDARVRSAIRHGGVVVHGDAEHAERPIAELTGPHEAPPPILAVPPVPPLLGKPVASTGGE